jgi:D-alanine--poly(phosphoribitol) ligase subunit 1
MDIVALIDRWGTSAPNRAAHISAGRTLTYGELVQSSDALASDLLKTLPQDRSPVVVLGHKEPEMLIGFLGALKSGRAYIPVDDSVPAGRVAQISESSGCAAVLTPADIRERIARTTSSRAAFPERRSDDPHYIIFTSGSTGTPKGVVISTRNLSAFTEWMLAEQRFEEGNEVFLNQAPFSFDLSVMDLYLSLITGGTLASLTRDEMSTLKKTYEVLDRSGVTTWVSTPSFAQLCTADARFQQALLPALRRFLFCGETLSPHLAAELLARFPSAEVWNTYGPTEATVAMTSIRVHHEIIARHGSLPVGKPMPGVMVSIRDAEGNSLPHGEVGEIVIHGPNVSAGYLGRPDLSARVFAENDGVRSYRTGDSGHLDEEGLLFVGGRMDNQIKLNGYRIELGDIETHLRELPHAQNSVVLPALRNGVPHMLAAFVIPRNRDGLSDLELMLRLRDSLAERLPAYMIPKKFVFVDQFPMTPNGKADRRKLAELL